jgi:hypothetical protein
VTRGDIPGWRLAGRRQGCSARAVETSVALWWYAGSRMIGGQEGDRGPVGIGAVAHLRIPSKRGLDYAIRAY